MAGDWIQMRTNLAEDPDVIAISCELDISECEVVGRLHRMWGWFDQHTDDGNAPSVTDAWLDRYTGVTGWCAALVHVGWLEVDDDGVRMAGFERYNGATAKKRARGRVRVQKSRSKRDTCNAPSVTDVTPPRVKSVTREEKRREESNTPPTPPPGGSVADDELPSADPPGFKLAPGEFAALTAGLDPGVLEALTSWAAHLREGLNRKPLGFAATVAVRDQLATWGPAKAAERVHASIFQNAGKLFEPDPPRGRKGATPPASNDPRYKPYAEQQAEREAEEQRLEAERTRLRILRDQEPQAQAGGA